MIIPFIPLFRAGLAFLQIRDAAAMARPVLATQAWREHYHEHVFPRHFPLWKQFKEEYADRTARRLLELKAQDEWELLQPETERPADGGDIAMAEEKLCQNFYWKELRGLYESWKQALQMQATAV